MLKQTIILAAIVGLVLVLAGEASAQVSESEIGISNPYVPETLRYEGAQFRLVFSTDGDYQALSTSIDWYNAQVTAEADTNTDLSGLGPWYVIGSTRTVSAKANTYTNSSDPSVPIHALSGSLVSDTYDHLWDGDYISGTIQDTPQGAVRTAYVHSGTRKEGVTSTWPLGGTLVGDILYTNWGDPRTTYQNWIHKSGGWPIGWGASPSENFQGLYGMSGILTVVADREFDATDYIALKTHMGQETSAGETEGDFDEDGDVDWDDLQILQDAFREQSDPNPVPEPATLMLLLGAGLPALLKRRRS